MSYDIKQQWILLKGDGDEMVTEWHWMVVTKMYQNVAVIPCWTEMCVAGSLPVVRFVGFVTINIVNDPILSFRTNNGGPLSSCEINGSVKLIKLSNESLWTSLVSSFAINYSAIYTWSTGRSAMCPVHVRPRELAWSGICRIFLGNGVFKQHTRVTSLHQELQIFEV